MKLREKTYTVSFTTYAPDSSKGLEDVRVKASTPKEAVRIAFERRQTIDHKKYTADIYEANLRNTKNPINTVVTRNRLIGRNSYYFYVRTIERKQIVLEGGETDAS